MNSPEKTPPENEHSPQANGTDINHSTNSNANRMKELLSPTQRKQNKLFELQVRKEHGEIHSNEFDAYQRWYIERNYSPLTKGELQNQALVLTRKQFDLIEIITIVRPSGEEIDIECEQLDPDDILIIYPEDLGNSK